MTVFVEEPRRTRGIGKNIRPSTETIQRVIAGYVHGATLEQLGVDHGTSAPTIRSWLLKAGIELSRRPNAPRTVRHCEICGGEFLGLSNRQRFCIVCIPDKAARQRYKLYKLTNAQFVAMLEAQGNRCLMCDVVFSETFDTCVDHCHTTGKVRAILCRGCNMVIARFEDPEYVARAQRYLAEHAPVDAR
ncbi:endonuclease VII [Mycobacterium phage Dori]|uniref:endonuclease VII n=1 Tax=Mycobacterium phage Dori TaxID=1089121 RepID=UPI000232F486|nr:endonuclease VII [Mycobacterium phage Dori]AER47653.1 EndoVII [Mycobacterium phage Dori]